MGCKVFKFFCKKCYLSDLKSILKTLWSLHKRFGLWRIKIGSVFFKYHEVQNWKSKTYLKDTCRGQKMGNCSDRQTVASCLIFSMSSILLPKSPTILWIGDLGKNLWFQTRFHEFSPQGGARQTRDSIIFFKGFDGSIMQLDNPIIYFVKLYMNC